MAKIEIFSDGVLVTQLGEPSHFHKGAVCSVQIHCTEYIKLRSDKKKLNELEQSIEWHLAPDWAEYVAVDFNGDMFWYEDRPTLDELEWYPDSKAIYEYKNVPLEGIDWKETLFKRP